MLGLERLLLKWRVFVEVIHEAFPDLVERLYAEEVVEVIGGHAIVC